MVSALRRRQHLRQLQRLEVVEAVTAAAVAAGTAAAEGAALSIGGCCMTVPQSRAERCPRIISSPQVMPPRKLQVTHIQGALKWDDGMQAAGDEAWYKS